MTKAPTAAEKRRMTILKENVPCLPCLKLEKISLPEVHHPVRGQRRIGHHVTISLCPFHHRGVPVNGWENLPGASGGANQATSGLLGPSLAWGRKPFEAFFGSEALLSSIATKLVNSYEQEQWIDYDVPVNIRRKVRDYWDRFVNPDN